MLYFIKSTCLTLSAFFSIYILFYFIFYMISSIFNASGIILENLKICRDIFITIAFLFCYTKINVSNTIKFYLDLKTIILFSIIIIVILILSKHQKETYDLHTIVSAIFISPILEELICREALFEEKYLILSFIFSAFIFILLHFTLSYEVIIFYFIISSILFFVRKLSGSVINPIILHSLINFIIIYL